MKKHFNFKSMYRTALVALCLLTVGVGQMWGTARTFKSGEKIYFKDASGNITWGNLNCLWKVSNGDIFAYFCNDSESAWSSSASVKYGTVNQANTIYEITVPGSGKTFTKVVFTRHPNPTADPTFDNKWNQTEDQTPDVGYNLFCIANDGSYDSQRNPNHKWKGNWSRYAHNGAVVGSFNDWNPDTYPLSNSGVAGALIPLEAGNYSFKILLGETYYGLNDHTVTSTLTDWWEFKSGEANVGLTVTVAGNYGIAWNAGTKKVTVYYPDALYPKNKYIYFDVTNQTYWNANAFTAQFYLKYFDSASDLDGMPLTCSSPLENYIYYVQVPDNGYIGHVQMNRWYNSAEDGIANVSHFYSRSSATKNCLIGSGSSKSYWDPTWGNYCPPTTLESLSDNNTTIVPGTNGTGASDNPILVVTGTTVNVSASASKAVNDGDMTITYDFKVNSGSVTTNTTGAYSFSASTNNTVYQVNVKSYTNYNLDGTQNSTKRSPSDLYYKALNAYTITYNGGANATSGSHGNDTQYYGIAKSLPDATFTRTGYTQTGWAKTDGGTQSFALSTNYTDNADVELFPVWTANQRVITLNGNGGSGNSENVTLTYDSNTHAAITAPTRSGYTFLGWYSGGDGSGNVSGSLIIDRSGVLQANVDGYTGADGIWKKDATTTLYAKWSPAYTITLDDEDAGTENQTVTATIGESFLIGSITNPTKYGYRFDAWKLSSGTELISNTGTLKSNVTDYTDADGKWIYTNNVTLTPVWSKVWCIRGQKQTGSGNVDGEIGGWGINTNILNPDGTTGTFEIELSANSTYELAVVDMTGSDKWYKGTTSGYAITSSSTSLASLTESTGDAAERNITLTTTNAGAYRFTFNFSTKAFTVTYPQYQVNFSEGDVDGSNSDPNAWSYNLNHAATNGNYYQSGDKIIIYSQDPKSGYKWKEWNTSSNGSGSQIKPYRNDTIESLSGTVTAYAIYEPKTYELPLVGMEATTHTQTSVSVTYNASTNMTASDVITKPTKNGYTFGGYWTSENTGITLGDSLIDADGKWIADVTGYTSNDGAGNPTWVHDYAISLYAQWTEDKHTVSVAVSPAGAGSVQVNSSNVSSVTGVGIATKSDEMTPIALAGWKFKEWQVTSNVQMDLVNYRSDYQQGTANKMKINATADDQTITAVFEPRYYLVGKIWDDSADGGMPGWDNYNKPFKVVTTSPVLDTCKVTLITDKSFYIEVRDKVDGFSYGKSGGTLNDNTTLTFTDKDNKVFVYSNGGTEYTFKITGIDGNGRPQVSVERPYQVNIGRKRVDIDGTDHDDNTGGTVAMSLTVGGDAVANGAWVPYGTSVKYDASKQTGYTVDWYNASDYKTWFSNADYWFHTATSTGNGYAKFTEKATTVTLSATNGQIKVGDTPSSETTCGITTTRSLNAVPNDGYMFSSWTKTSGDDISISSTSTNPTTLSGLGGGESSGQTVTANFALRWALKAESSGWGSASFDIDNISTVGGDAVGYVDISLAANTNYQFTITDKQGSGATYYNGTDKVYYMTNGNSYVWGFGTDKTYNCGITTAGAGTYRFMWNITDRTMSVIYPNFVIYRTGDKDEDSESASHTTTSAVESYAGGTINQGIEFRMKVPALDTWYTLCLPFTVSAVKVWDEADGAYYDIYPYYRSGGKYIAWHYIIRTPKTATDLSIAEFDDWDDPTEKDFLPSTNTPYIIQWHDSYFTGKYISFFGATGQTIPTSMTAGSAPSSDNVVNVHGNDAMKSGTIRDAYLLENDYGTYGAWLREDIGTDRTILPFECYIRAKAETAARYRVLRRDMTIDDTPTGLDQIINRKSSNRKFIKDGQLFIIRDEKMYNVYGMEVQQ